MPKVTINGQTIEVPDGTNVVKAAEMLGQEIPHYCYHPGLTVAGNCRMCLIDVVALSEKQPSPLPKLQIGCNTIVQNGMVIETDNDKVREARKHVLEYLLINHPIDCPICDQAGECKLQEYYMDYGRYQSRFALDEKVDKAKVVPIGPSVMLDKERCILCTRCIRFLEEVTHTHELTLHERGDHSEIALTRGAWVDNGYAGNIVDICPVGALTSRDFRFTARVWYLDRTESICTGCATGCNTEVHSRNDVIYRVKPRANPEVNGYWMCDFGRTVFASNARPERLSESLSREGDRFVSAPFADVALRAALGLGRAGAPAALASASLSLEEGFLLAEIVGHLGGGPCLMLSPEESDIEDDDLLISHDRYPNRRGLEALGFTEAASLDGGVGALLIARCDPVAHDAGWGPLLEAMSATVVLDEQGGESCAYADHVLAIASHFESEGTFINRTGQVQAFQAAVRPPGEAVKGWYGLAYLLRALGGTKFGSLADVREAMAARLEANAILRSGSGDPASSGATAT